MKAFATISFEGDRLSPGALDDVLGVRPTLAYRKGETYTVGRRGITRIGETGYWYFTTEGAVASDYLDDHLGYLARVLANDPRNATSDEKLAAVRDLVARLELRAVATCFWHGTPGASAPQIPPTFAQVAARVPAEIETDFCAEHGEPTRGRYATA